VCTFNITDGLNFPQKSGSMLHIASRVAFLLHATTWKSHTLSYKSCLLTGPHKVFQKTKENLCVRPCFDLCSCFWCLHILNSFMWSLLYLKEDSFPVMPTLYGLVTCSVFLQLTINHWLGSVLSNRKQTS